MSQSRRSSSRHLSRRKRRRWPLVLLVLLLLAAAGAGAWYLAGDESDDTAETTDVSSPTASASPSPRALPFTEVIAATTDEGDVELASVLRVTMPEELDDGVPERRIKGEGALAADRSVAGLTYAMDDVPNSAGYFGHVPGDLQIIHTEDDMLISFRLLTKNVLEGGAEWMSFDLPFLSSDYLLRVGVGQLRELALSDPRVGISLLGSVKRADPSPVEEDLDGETVSVHEVEAETVEALQADPELEPVFREIRDGLRITTVPMTAWVDENDQLLRLEYEFEFDPKKGPGTVRLVVRHDLTESELQDSIELPEPDAVVSYDEYFAQQ